MLNICKTCACAALYPAGPCEICLESDNFAGYIPALQGVDSAWDNDKTGVVDFATIKENGETYQVKTTGGYQPSKPITSQPPNTGTSVQSDNVTHPSHYTQGKVECIDAIEAAVTGLTGMEAVCTAQCIKYLWRWRHKNGLEDLRKAGWYLDRLIERVERLIKEAEDER